MKPCLKYALLTLLPAVISPAVHAQQSDMQARDSIHSNNIRTLALRLGAGLTPHLYGEGGVSFHRYHYRFLKSTSSAFYAALEIKPTMYMDRGFLMLGPKMGYELSAYGIAAAAEAKYQSDGKNKDFVLTPKAGFSLMGLANLMYGYNVSFNNYPFPGIGRHQFSLIFNLYKRPLRKGALSE